MTIPRLLTLLSLLLLALCSSAAKRHQQPNPNGEEEENSLITCHNTTVTTPVNITVTATPGVRSNVTRNSNETSMANNATLVDVTIHRSLHLLEDTARTMLARNKTTPGARTNQTTMVNTTMVNTTSHAHNQTTPAADPVPPRVVNLTGEHMHRLLARSRSQKEQPLAAQQQRPQQAQGKPPGFANGTFANATASEEGGDGGAAGVQDGAFVNRTATQEDAAGGGGATADGTTANQTPSVQNGTLSNTTTSGRLKPRGGVAGMGVKHRLYRLLQVGADGARRANQSSTASNTTAGARPGSAQNTTATTRPDTRGNVTLAGNESTTITGTSNATTTKKTPKSSKFLLRGLQGTAKVRGNVTNSPPPPRGSTTTSMPAGTSVNSTTPGVARGNTTAFGSPVHPRVSPRTNKTSTSSTNQTVTNAAPGSGGNA